MEQTDTVLVVGGGPIGLVAACALAHHGVSVQLIEKRTEPRDSSRANNLWARVQELLQSVGLRSPLAEHSYRITKQTLLVNGRPLNQTPLDVVDSPYAEVLYSGQGVIEQTLLDQARERGVVIRQGCEVTSLAQDSDGVTVEVANLDENGERTGAAQTERFSYVIGADGNGGLVRKSLSADFEPTKMPSRTIRSIDAKLRWQRSTDCDQLWFFTYRNGLAGVLPVWEGYHRFFFLEDEAEMPARDPTLEEMQARAREVVGDDTLTLTEPIWFSFGRFQHGVAASYGEGRVFLAGDAGHTTLPIGGQGMNAGIHDAIGIAWRLAMTLAGHASPAVLASYSKERHSAHADLDKQQAKGFENLVYRGRLADAALDAVGRLFPGISTKLLANDDLQQLNVAYPDSKLSEDNIRSGVGAGQRAPDAPLIAATGETKRLFPILYNADGHSWGWNLLAFDGADRDAIGKLRAGLETVAPWKFVRSTLIVSSPSALSKEAAAPDSLTDLDLVAHRAYGLDGTPAFVLVRPDGHIALRAPAERTDVLQAYAERVFTPATAKAA